MEKKGKQITRWKTGATKLQGAAYLREMAEQGWILEDMNHLMYTFREEEPQYLKYRILNRDCVMAQEEREAYEKDGWKEVCHYELEYIFVKEREPFEEDAELQRQEVAEEIDRQLKQDLDMRKSMVFVTVFIVVGFLAMFFLNGSLRGNGIALTQQLLFSFGPNLLFVLLGGWLVNRRLKKKKRQVEDGDIPDEYTDWRKQKHKGTIGVLIGFLIIGWAICLEAGWNQKKYDLPAEVSYWDIPAVRHR